MDMERSFSRWSVHRHLVLWCSLLVIWSSTVTSAPEQPETYIIHMDPTHKPSSFSSHESWHQATLDSLSSSKPSSSRDKLIYSYNHVMHGFSATLTSSELSEIEKSPAHRATYRERYGKLFTTHSPKFLGLNHRSGLWPAASYGHDVIVGILDTGIWPESESFGDRGFSAVPARWNGACENGTQFSPSLCNRKLIGARSFSKGLKAGGRNISTKYDFDSPRDFFGHGTHTASTAAGAFVQNADYFGYAEGTAKGLAPGARLAMYKVLWATDTYESASTDVLAGMDQAIADGVDIMSLSLGFDFLPYYDDVIAIGALSAVQKGIFVACAAGNDGSNNSTYNGAPWIMTVGAGTIDRSYLAELSIGEDLQLKGTSYYPQSLYISNAPLYYGKNDSEKAQCLRSSLDPAEVHRKVVLCDLSNQTDIFGQIEEVSRARAIAGIFLMNGMFMDVVDYYKPSVVITESTDAEMLRSYAMKEMNATVKELRFRITELGTKPAPRVAYFSSRGPDPVTPTVLKPDILAPGKDILAAWISNKPFLSRGAEKLVTDYALLSGTSMASPHIAGVAALLRSVHRDWTPAAIRSAIMTTARSLDNARSIITDEWTNLPATPLEFGAGHVNPNQAMDPGLIYDVGFEDYVQFLCTLGYTEEQMAAIVRQGQWSCNTSSADLNYPSFMAVFTNGTGTPMVKNFSRVVTNVGDDNAIYHAVVEIPYGMTIRVVPDTLTFSGKNQKMGFSLTVEVDKEAWSSKPVAYGFLKWVDQQNHIVSSPVVAISL
ncbi:subtilisin-like protease SBT3 [Aristolochia californica]|uniref:subtilisin-like protease SBT3 n=1 Tax=Aristolochia californica TaxID=171875 RepID=UPI0035DCD043